MASTSTSGRDPFLVVEPPNNKIKSSLSVKQYDVFINHRGPDVKATLALQLYKSLQKAGIPAYLASEETELGDLFSSTIKNAIFSAKVHIAIFSQRYAESAWCLAELALMFQTRARIIPLFYHVEPSDFRHIKKGVADAFSTLEEKGRYPNHDIQQWKECLQNVSGIKGYEINGQNDDLNKLCYDIVSAVVKEKQKRKIPLQVAKYGVGLDELVKDFHGHCETNGQMRDKIIGIFGMGGSGKTTLAKDLFNRKHSEFSGSTILFDVRENDVKGALTSVQSKLLNDLFPGNQYSFCSIEEGTAYIKHDLRGSQESKFLIVIDDADNQKQLDAVVPMDALNPNSLVIVTTRDERLLIQAGIRVRYKMKKMNPEHSRELFCWHAFHRQSCKSGFENLVDRFVKGCGGLPLALQVMGGHVFGSDKAYWKLQLDVLKARLHKDIKDALKISYEALEEDQKQIFMDIACFFIGKKVSPAISIWKASKWRAEHALQTLKDKCLIEMQLHVEFTISGQTYRKDEEPTLVLRTHDHLRDLGREMADNEMSNPHRQWHPEDHLEMQNILTESKRKNFRYFNETEGHVTYLIETSKTSTDLQWLELHTNYCQLDDTEMWLELYYPDIPEWILPDIPEWIPLKNLHTLRLHGVSPARLWQRDDQGPLKLKELYCYPYYQTGAISSFGKLKHLESLHLEGTEDECEECTEVQCKTIEWNCFLKSLRELTNLKTLELARFEVDGEFDLSNKGETTDDRFRMRSLEAITLYDGLKISKLSISGQVCPTLKSLKLYNMTNLIEVDLTGVTTLECLVLLNCGGLGKIVVSNLPELEMFHIKSCQTMKELPNFGRFSCLKRVYINNCKNLQDISGVERLQGLNRISIARCPELTNIKAIEQLKGLKRIWIEECKMLQGVICFKELKGLKRIFIGHCPRLHNIEGIEYLIYLESIMIVACPKLQSITGIEELKGFKEMIIADSPIISCLERLQTEVEEEIHSFHKSQHSLSTFIFCALLDECPWIQSEICNGIMVDNGLGLEPTRLCRGDAVWIYTCVVNEERLSKYDSWMPFTDRIMTAFLMGMKAGGESKTLHVLQSLFAQLYVGEYNERNDEFDYDDYDDYDDHDDHVDYVDLVEYVDDEESDGGDDD